MCLCGKHLETSLQRQINMIEASEVKGSRPRVCVGFSVLCYCLSETS